VVTVTDLESSLPQEASKLSDILQDVRNRIGDLATKLSGLESAYRDAGEDLKNRAATDAEYISQLKDEADRLIILLRGGSLFGRYAEDAELHRRTANRWRFFAVVVLLGSAALQVVLAIRVPSLGWIQTIAILPLVLLFTYTSLESHNHRRREFDRRRIYLRMAAIESYIRPAGDGQTNRQESKKILDEFIRRHFIEPDLDANDMNYVVARGAGPLTARLGRRKGGSSSSES
jgi:hypothetical protein